jgi:signal transduction histidine kinase
VEIDLGVRGERMVVTILDDGVGLPQQWSRAGHFGLRGLADRVENLNGKLAVANRDDGGVCLIAEIPLTAAA